MVTERQLEEAIQYQVLYGGRLGTNLYELGFITEARLQEALSRAHGVPTVAVDVRSIEADRYFDLPGYLGRSDIEAKCVAMAGNYYGKVERPEGAARAHSST